LILLILSSFSLFQTYANQTKLEFFIISCNNCEEYKERLVVLEKCFPGKKMILYAIEEEQNIERFRIISEIIGCGLYMPLVGIFINGSLSSVVNGGLYSEDSWRYIVHHKNNGVTIYSSEMGGKLNIENHITDLEKIAFLESNFRESNFEDGAKSWSFYQLLPFVLVSAFADALNPCSFIIFVTLLTLVFYEIGQKAVPKVSLAFTFGIFLSYFLLGLGLIRILQVIPNLKYFFSLLTLFLGILRIFGAMGTEINLIPQAFAIRISKRIETTINIKSGLVSGIFIGFLLLPCSSAPYFVVLNLISQKASLKIGLTLLVFYNLVIIAPFFIITLLVYSILLTTMDLKLWSLENKKWLNLFMGLIIVILSVYSLII
jgi:cytochrome c biogenesis protein CcdA